MMPKPWIRLLLLAFLTVQVFSNIDNPIDTKEYFCGKKLVKTLNELCSFYNTPNLAYSRFRRQIVDECCRSQCSRRHLIQYYCLETKSSMVELLKSKSKPETNTKRPQNNEDLVSVDSEASNHDGITNDHDHGSNYNCRKRRAKWKKKRFQTAPKKYFKQVPPANIGQVEHSQRPFYVWKFSRL